MKPAQERRTLAELDRAIGDLQALRKMILDVLARDDQDAKPDVPFVRAPHDPVRVIVRRISSQITRAAIAAGVAVNGARWVMDAQPDTIVRQVSIPDCLCCGELALPRPKAGFCAACYQAWVRWRRGKKQPDRAIFITERREQIEVSPSSPRDETSTNAAS